MIFHGSHKPLVIAAAIAYPHDQHATHSLNEGTAFSDFTYASRPVLRWLGKSSESRFSKSLDFVAFRMTSRENCA